MPFRAVRNRVAVDFTELKLPIDDAQAMQILKKLGVKEVPVDLIALARSRVRRATYRRGARLSEAPETFDCSSFVKWLYGERGIWIPRYSIDQIDFGTIVIPSAIKAGDLIFNAGNFSWYHDDPKCGVGHVGIVAGEKTVIHAADSKTGVVEELIESWFSCRSFRGVRRIIPFGHDVRTLEFPPELEIETSGDLRWKILQRLPR